MPKTAVAIRHVHFEDLGSFRPVLEAGGYAIRYCDVGINDLHVLATEDIDLLVVLGGMSVTHQSMDADTLGARKGTLIVTPLLMAGSLWRSLHSTVGSS